MDFKLDTLRKSEQVSFLLRGLYEQYGYEKFRMGKFEEYDFYTEHKDFLSSSQILTFTDLSGKLMALKPDVTMSIVKRTRASMQQPERLYYNESIYRASREVREFKEIYQVGLEYIGEVSTHTNAELLTLALKSLQCITDEYILDVSHMGYLNGLFESITAPKEAKQKFLTCLESKNAHELQRLLGEYAVSSADGERLLAVLTLNGGIQNALSRAGELAVNEQMRTAVAELSELYRVFADNPMAQSLRLDFSITLDSKYYNGLMFRGYVKDAPRAVLRGGRYDLLLRRMGIRELQAIGFAIYFDEVERLLKQPPRAAYTAVLLFDDTTDPKALHAAAEQLTTYGHTLLVSRALPQEPGGYTLFTLQNGTLTEKLP